MTTLSIGFAFDMGKNSLVFAFNSPVTVATPKGYEAKISPALTKQGVKAQANGKIKFPGKSVVIGLIIVDDEFEMVRVIIPTKAALVAASLEMKIQGDQSSTWARIEELAKSIPDDSLTADLVDRLFEISPKPLIDFYTDVAAKMEGVNFDAIIAELVALAEKRQADLPDSATDPDQATDEDN